MSTTDELVEQLTKPKSKRKGGNTMSKETKPKRNYNHFKDIVITILITGVIAFIGGMVYQSKFNDRVEARASQIAKQNVVSRDTSKN